jgi:putative flippase GtrA
MPMTLVVRGMRFSLVGALVTLLAYAIFAPLVYVGVPYMAANVTAWAICVVISFVLNRYVTFRIRGPESLPFQFGKFVVGSVMQFVLASGGYWMLMSVLHLGPTVAFAINLALTAGFMFIYLNAVAFRA